MLTSESKDKDRTKPQIWNTIWSRPYINYEKYHQVFWKKIREISEGRVVDLGCGSASCWKIPHPEQIIDLIGYDFSEEGIKESKINCPWGSFIVKDLTNVGGYSHIADTVVLCGIINYYEDINPILNEARRLLKNKGKIIITINVIDDFPKRHWDQKEISKQFAYKCSQLEAEFIEGIGWFLVLCYDGIDEK